MKQNKSELNKSELPIDGYVRISKLLGSEIIPFSRATLYRMINAGKFPKPVKVGGITMFIVAEIRNWMNELNDQRSLQDVA